jgi:hypothetical protein
MIRQNEMHFWIQHNEISKTQLRRFLLQKKSFYLQASVNICVLILKQNQEDLLSVPAHCIM